MKVSVVKFVLSHVKKFMFSKYLNTSHLHFKFLLFHQYFSGSNQLLGFFINGKLGETELNIGVLCKFMYTKFSILIIHIFHECLYVLGMQKEWFSKVHLPNVFNIFLLIYQNILRLPTTGRLTKKHILLKSNEIFPSLWSHLF